MKKMLLTKMGVGAACGEKQLMLMMLGVDAARGKRKPS